MRIAFVTCQQYPAIAGSDQLCADLLVTQGHRVEAAPWNDQRVDWSAFDLTVFRSCWDYCDHLDSFEAFLRQLETLGIATGNPVAMLQWNLHKRYLLELSSRGLAIPRTILLDRGQTVASVPALAGARGWPADWSQLVIKPCVSASGAGVSLLGRGKLAQGTLDLNQALARADMLLQEYVPEVAANGEQSYVFFEGVFSHAVLKQVGPRASPGEFRINSQHGGISGHITADPVMLGGARRTLELISESFGEPPLYARIDGIKRGNTFVLMEAELIEPGLFFTSSDQGAASFARAIVKRAQIARKPAK